MKHDAGILHLKPQHTPVRKPIAVPDTIPHGPDLAGTLQCKRYTHVIYVNEHARTSPFHKRSTHWPACFLFHFKQMLHAIQKITEIILEQIAASTQRRSYHAALDC